MSVVARSIRKVLRAEVSPGAPSLSFRLDSLQVPDGSHLAVLGPSGCGKSLLLALLAGITLPDEGRIEIGSTRMDSLGCREREEFRRRSIGLALQGENLLSGWSVFENVLLGLRFNSTYPRLQWRARASEMLTRVGLGHCRRRRPGSLASVDRQKVVIARTLVHHPNLLLIDEPTARLDPGSANQVLQLLIEMAKEGGQTMILFTDDPSIAGRLDQTFDASHLLERSDLPL
jgi:ABC-type lipoprotein export system ATPase subunit